MALADLAKAPAAPGRKECRTAWIAAQLSAEDRADLEAALANTGAAWAAIADELTSMGYRIDGQTVGRHGRGLCLCGKAYRA